MGAVFAVPPTGEGGHNYGQCVGGVPMGVDVGRGIISRQRMISPQWNEWKNSV